MAAIESGMIQREIQESAYRAQLAIDAGTATVVGVNRFVAEAEAARMPTLSIDPEIERQQIARLRAVRAGRSASACEAALAAVATAAGGATNLVPPIFAAVEAQATVGEIADAMRAVFGEHKEVASL